MPRPLLFRVDADAAIGAGHALRCLALAQAWPGETHFLMADPDPAIAARLGGEGVHVHSLDAPPSGADDAEETIALARTLRADWLVLDGYHLGAVFQESVKSAGLRLLAIDDYGHAHRYAADLVLNQNIEATERFYDSRSPRTRLLLGPAYFLLRREFVDAAPVPKRQGAAATAITLALGGGPGGAVASRILGVLARLGRTDIDVRVIGDVEPRATPFACRFEKRVPDMPTRLAATDLLVTAGGVTAYEAAFLGVPTALLITAENQRGTAEAFGQRGMAVNLGWHEAACDATIGKALTRLLSGRQRVDPRGVVDGCGCERVLQAMESTPC